MYELIIKDHKTLRNKLLRGEDHQKQQTTDLDFQNVIRKTNYKIARE